MSRSAPAFRAGFGQARLASVLILVALLSLTTPAASQVKALVGGRSYSIESRRHSRQHKKTTMAIGIHGTRVVPPK